MSAGVAQTRLSLSQELSGVSPTVYRSPGWTIAAGKVWKAESLDNNLFNLLSYPLLAHSYTMAFALAENRSGNLCTLELNYTNNGWNDCTLPKASQCTKWSHNVNRTTPKVHHQPKPKPRVSARQRLRCTIPPWTVKTPDTHQHRSKTEQVQRPAEWRHNMWQLADTFKKSLVVKRKCHACIKIMKSSWSSYRCEQLNY